MINSIFGQSPNPYRQDPIHRQPVLPKTEAVIHTSLNSNGQNPNCPMYKNPNQKDAENGNEFDGDKANKVFNPYCLVCSQSLCRIKNLLAEGLINPSEFNPQESLIGTIINLEV